jgi:hypothetical protein
MLLEPLRGVIVAEVVPEIEEAEIEEVVKVPENFSGGETLILKAIYDDEERRFIYIDPLRFKSEKKPELKNAFCMNRASFDYLSQVYLEEKENVEKFYGLFQIPEKIWLHNKKKKRFPYGIELDEIVLQALPTLENV